MAQAFDWLLLIVLGISLFVVVGGETAPTTHEVEVTQQDIFIEQGETVDFVFSSAGDHVWQIDPGDVIRWELQNRQGTEVITSGQITVTHPEGTQGGPPAVVERQFKDKGQFLMYFEINSVHVRTIKVFVEENQDFISWLAGPLIFGGIAGGLLAWYFRREEADFSQVGLVVVVLAMLWLFTLIDLYWLDISLTTYFGRSF
jgi:hypothetical protein